ncbi:MAG: bifunctional phosphoglucose/phosphomannose isomerase [Candidatus Bathyarchaeia archaeon]
MPKLTILDSLDEIKKIDKSNMLSFCVEAPKHYGNAAKLVSQFKIGYPKPEVIIVAGMGGSAIGGELLKDWARDRLAIPVDVCREYHLPAYANKNTLVLATSYSGETEETLNVFLEALKRNCMIICISSGGALTEFAGKLSIPHLLVPSGMAPRATLPYLFMPLLGILEKMGLAAGVDTEFSETVRVLKRISSENSPERPLNDNFSKKLAANVDGTVPAVYGFGFYRAVAQRLKTQFNENSKNLAKWESLPELNHNEIVGWEAAKEFAKLFSVVFIRDAEEPKEIRQRIEFTKETVGKGAVKLFEVWSSGKSSLARMSSVICVGDFTSVYLAVLRGIDPTPVRTIVLLKERLKQTGVKEKTVRELQKLAKK